MKPRTYKVTIKIWLYPGESSNWHFISVPKKESADINKRFSEFKKGWGSLPVQVTLGKTTWKTSIFPDKKSNTYLLPLKAQVRRKEGLEVHDSVTVKFNVLV